MRREPVQAQLVISSRMLKQLRSMPQEEQDRIQADVDAIAAAHGLLTPTKFIEAEDPS